MHLKTFPILSCAEVAAYESSRLTDQNLIRAAIAEAGRKIGEQVLIDFAELDAWPASPQILVLAGKGHNAADALIAAATIAEELADVHVDVLWAQDSSQSKPLVQEALETCKSKVASLEETVWDGSLPNKEWTLLLDGLLGQSVELPLRAPYDKIIIAANALDVLMKAAIDLPSGLANSPELSRVQLQNPSHLPPLGEEAKSEGESDSPELSRVQLQTPSHLPPRGEEAEPEGGIFQADFTYMTGLPKEPVVGLDGHPSAGRIRLIELSFVDNPPSSNRPDVWVAQDVFKVLRRFRKAKSDKRDYGYIGVIAGSQFMPGAALMAASGCLQAGAGLVSVFMPANAISRLAPALPEAMWQPVPFTPEGGIDSEAIRILQSFAPRINSVLIGPGLRFDKPTNFAVSRMIRELRLPIVLDAGALNQDVLAAVWGRPDNKIPVVLTPHTGEFQRLIGPKADPTDPANLLNLAEKHSAIVVLKGPITRICDGQTIYHLATGGPTLARGGSGDILAGMLATLIAQHPDNILSAVIRGVAWHGAAAEHLARQEGQIALRTTQLLPALSAVLRS